MAKICGNRNCKTFVERTLCTVGSICTLVCIATVVRSAFNRGIR
jgi:hypothetical protein